MLLVYPSDANPDLSVDVDRHPAVWNPKSDEAVDVLDEINGAAWFGRGLLAGSFADGKALYDISAHTKTHTKPPTPSHPNNFVWMSPGGERTYASRVNDDPQAGRRCEIWTYDPHTRRRVAPTIKLETESDDDCFSLFDTHVSGTRDGRRVVVTTALGTRLRTTVHDGRTGEQLVGPLHGVPVTSVSPDGVLVGGGGSGTITQYDLDTLEPIGTFPGTQSSVMDLRFSADGKILLATSLNQTLSIYDVASRSRLGDPIANEAPALTGGIRPDGKAVATNSPRGVTIWDINPDHLAHAACQVAGRNLTPTEWDTYLARLGNYRATCPNHD